MKTRYTKLFKQGETKCNWSSWTEGILAAKSVATAEKYLMKMPAISVLFLVTVLLVLNFHSFYLGLVLIQ